jgi:DNA mismatch repair ATPase MutL
LQHNDLPQDDADVAAGSRLPLPDRPSQQQHQQQQQQQQQDQQQRQQRHRPYLMKSASSSHPSSPTTRHYQTSSGNHIIINNNDNSNGNSKHSHQHHENHLDSNSRNNSALPNVDSYATLDTSYTIDTAPSSVCTINSAKGNTGDLEFFEDMITEPVMVLGIDISHLSKATQFSVCAAGLFFFSLLYGYLQELLSVTLCSRQLGLFLATTQFAGYTILAYIMRNYVYRQQQNFKQRVMDQHAIQYGSEHTGGYEKSSKMFDSKYVPLTLYLGLSVLRAIDLAMVRYIVVHFFCVFLFSRGMEPFTIPFYFLCVFPFLLTPDTRVSLASYTIFRPTWQCNTSIIRPKH